MPLSPPRALKVLWFPSPPSLEVDSCAVAAAAASALSRSAEGGRPRLRRGTPGKVLRRDLRGVILVSISLFRLETLDSLRPPLGNFASVSRGCAESTDSLLLPFLSLSSSASTPNSNPACLPSSPAAWLPVLQAFLLLEDGGRPLLFSPVPGGLPGSLFTFSAGRSSPSGFARVGEGKDEREGKLEAAFWAVRTRGGRPLGFFSCMGGAVYQIRE